DVAVFNSASGVKADLGLGTATGDGNDVLRHIEGLQAGDGNDTLTGDSSDNLLVGGNGNDRLIGAAGDDTLDGGAGDDLLNGGDGTDIAVFDDPAGVYANLGLGIATAEGHDTLVGIEGFKGGDGDDTFIGDGNNNVLLGE